MLNKCKMLGLALFFSAFIFANNCLADGSQKRVKESWEYPANSSEFEVEKPDPSSKINDKRPEYPGQEQEVGGGKTIRRWSTKGPVEVAPAPQPFDQIENRRVPAIGGIIVDSDRPRR